MRHTTHQRIPLTGGATVWPYLGVSVFPEKGSSAMWFNVRSDAQVDNLSLHAACPVLLGQKWSELRKNNPHGVISPISIQIYLSSFLNQARLDFFLESSDVWDAVKLHYELYCTFISAARAI